MFGRFFSQSTFHFRRRMSATANKRKNMLTLKGSVLIACLISITMIKAEGNTEASESALAAVSQGINQFSTSLLQSIVEENPGNLICSPLSAAVVLAMAAYGARGETKKQFKNVLHLPSSDTLGTSGYQTLISNLNNVKDNKLLLANKAFLDEKFNVKSSYKELTQNYFHSISQLVNFAQSEQAANTINTWVKENTNNHIEEIVSSNALSADTALVLVNAIYFKGMWKNKFQSALTKNMPFHINEKTLRDVPTMFRRGTYNYGILPQMNAKFIEIPYKGDEMSMLIILPNEINGLAEVEKKMINMYPEEILSQGSQVEVELHLPKFKIESKIDLNSPLKKLGLADMFSERANFSGIADGQNIAVSKVVQKAFIEVNEEGSEAAAVTGVIVTKLSLVYPEEFTVNRPFYYNIILKRNGEEENAGPIVSLFSGYVTEPKI